MRIDLHLPLLASLFFALTGSTPLRADDSAVALPHGVKAVWDFSKADRHTTPTRERICINGLWRWQPASAEANDVPTKNWGYFKVPGAWPGITDYLQKDCQTVFAAPSWKNDSLAKTTMAWYEREIAIPSDWAGRRIVLSAEYVNSYAAVFLDGKKAGDIRFPGGEADITAASQPGKTQMLSLLVVAMPLKETLLSYQDTNSAKQRRATVPRRGLCGDVFLASMPAGARITDFKVDTSVRKGEITFDAAIDKLPTDGEFELLARVTDHGHAVRGFRSQPFKASDLKEGRFAFTEKWAPQPDKYWDTDTPQNQFDVTPSLVRVGGILLDQAHDLKFGFREFWIDGRDFFLNGTRIFLSAVPLDNAEIGAVYGNLRCDEGKLRAAEKLGHQFRLHAQLRLPAWLASRLQRNPPGSRRHGHARLDVATPFLALRLESRRRRSEQRLRAHCRILRSRFAKPSLHCRLCDEPQWNRLRRRHESRSDRRHQRSARQMGGQEYQASDAGRGDRETLRSEPDRLSPCVGQSRLDARQQFLSRISCRFRNYPIGSSIGRPWASSRCSPANTGPRSPGIGACIAAGTRGNVNGATPRCRGSFASPNGIRNSSATRLFISRAEEKANLRWEAKKFRTGDGWLRWEYPQSLDSKVFDSRYDVLAMYLTDNWRAFRTWGVSAISAWQHDFFWKAARRRGPEAQEPRGRLGETPTAWI